MADYQKVKFMQIKTITNSSPVIVYGTLSLLDQISLDQTIVNLQYTMGKYF
jgi:hypothetical protein